MTHKSVAVPPSGGHNNIWAQWEKCKTSIIGVLSSPTGTTEVLFKSKDSLLVHL